MNRSQIEHLVKNGKFPSAYKFVELLETHISWVILCDEIVYKIKKPVKFDFLDFSTPQKREFYCHEEVVLNRRLAKDIYQSVVYIHDNNGKFEISLQEPENTIDYAVMMKKMNPDKRMDKLLRSNKVSLEQIDQIAKTLKEFHDKTETIYDLQPLDLKSKFNDIDEISDFVKESLGIKYKNIIKNSIHKSDQFLKQYEAIIKLRSELGLIKDCHGDLHSKNIFLLDEPIIFDCIEFNPSFRHLDILNELAFFCMDLEAYNHHELSQYFMVCYNKLEEIIHSNQESQLFIYYKAYHANVRAKVSAMEAQKANSDKMDKAVEEIKLYLDLLNQFISELD